MATRMWLGTDSTDPTAFDAAANWSGSTLPGSGDTVVFSPTYNNACTKNVDQGTTAYGEIVVEPGFTQQIGNATDPLKCTPGKFEYHGGGIIYADLGAASIPVVVTNSGSGAGGTYGVYLEGTITTVSVSGGKVAVASFPGDSATITTVRQSGGTVLLGAGSSSPTTVTVNGGSFTTKVSAATVNVYKGTFTTGEAAAITTKLNAYGGNLNLSGSGTIADLLLDGNAEIDFTKSGVARTVSAIKNNGGAISYDPGVITFTAESAPDRIIRKSVTVA